LLGLKFLNFLLEKSWLGQLEQIAELLNDVTPMLFGGALAVNASY
jgi:hypothetical protein